MSAVFRLLVAALASSLAAALAGLAFPPEAQNAREIAQRVFPAVVLLVMEDKNGQPLSLGSGFFVRDGVVATNMHVIEGAARGHAKLVGQKTQYDVAGLVARDIAHDLVLLAITGARAPSLSLGDSHEVAIGDKLYVVGNPLGLEGTFSEGIVSGFRQVGPDTLLQITAPISPGSSGGPVLNARGEVIGVAVATFKEGQNLNFAIPSSYLESLLGSMKPIRPLSAARGTTEHRSILDGLGGRVATGVIGTQFAWKATNLLAFYGDFSFSLRNQLRESVKEVRYLIAFHDRYGKPIEAHEGATYPVAVIPPGLAKRVTGSVDDSVRPLTARVEIRVLDFKLANKTGKALEPPKPEIEKTESPITIPREWIQLEDQGTVIVRIEGDYLYEQSSFSGDGGYIKEGSYICETKRQGSQWIGKCHQKLLLVWRSAVAPTWCPLELEEIITSISPHRIEGESQAWDYPDSVSQCPRVGATRTHFTLIPKY